MKWFPIESNPEVMNVYLGRLGLAEPRAEFVDVYGVSTDLLEMVPRPVYAVALVYPITDTTEKVLKEKTTTQKQDVEALRRAHPLVYMKQYTSNACGTVAILHAALNNYDKLGGVAQGSVLSRLHEAAQGASSEALGTLVSNDKQLELAHADAAESGATQNESIDTPIDLHFVTFVHVGDRCVELDGRQENPILHGECTTNELFVSAVGAAVQERMNLVPDSFAFGITALVEKA